MWPIQNNYFKRHLKFPLNKSIHNEASQGHCHSLMGSKGTLPVTLASKHILAQETLENNMENYFLGKRDHWVLLTGNNGTLIPSVGGHS